MKKYQANRLVNPEIKEIEVERETDQSVWIKGRAERKQSNYSAIFDTYEEAKAYLELHYKSKVEGAERHLKYCKEKYQKALNL